MELQNEEKLFDHKGDQIETPEHVINRLMQQGGAFDEIERILNEGTPDEKESVVNISIKNAEKDLEEIAKNVDNGLNGQLEEAQKRLNKIKDLL